MQNQTKKLPYLHLWGLCLFRKHLCLLRFLNVLANLEVVCNKKKMQGFLVV